jgi:adenylate cyclase
MADGRTNRKMSAILSADVKGYSRLMSTDEEGTVKSLNECREIIAGCVDDHRGRVVDSPGDNVLAEFVSTVEAVKCAVKIQEGLKARNADLPESRRMEFRIGVNLGDVIEDDDRIYGDGVNIAARLEGLAEAGGICISRTAFDQVKNKLELGYEYLGEHKVKNITEPVPVYRVLMEAEVAGKVIGEKRKEKRRIILAAIIVLLIGFGGLAGWYLYLEQSKRVEAASLDKMAYPLPDKPSIAVLPIVNMSGDPQQEFFSDGLTEDLITALSKVPNLFVIARNSSFVYKGKPAKVQQVAEDLGVRFVLEGSVQKEGNRVRITAQLIDALKGYHVWSERYDREMKDFFSLQDQIALEVLKAIDVKLSRGEGGRIHGKGTNNLEAYLTFLKARELCYEKNRENNAQARKLTKQVISLDPNYPIAYHTLAVVTATDVWLGMSKSPKESLMKAIELEQKAISLDDSCASAYAHLGFLYVQIREYEKGIAAGERAIEIAPNMADAYAYFAQVLNFSGRPEEAARMVEKAFRLNPVGPSSYYYMWSAHTYRLTGRYEDAVEMCKELLGRWPNNAFAHAALAIIYAEWGREEDAHAATQDLLRIAPKFSAQRYARLLPYKDPALNARVLENLRRAGVPE